jgi:hypothetical protein
MRGYVGEHKRNLGAVPCPDGSCHPHRASIDQPLFPTVALNTSLPMRVLILGAVVDFSRLVCADLQAIGHAKPEVKLPIIVGIPSLRG